MKRLALKEYQKTLVRKIVTCSLNTVSYKSLERSQLIDLIVSEIVEKDDKMLWLEDLDEFLKKCDKSSVRTQHKYYLKDYYESCHSLITLLGYDKFLDRFVAEVRKAKNVYSNDLRYTVNSITSYYRKKRASSARKREKRVNDRLIKP